MRSEARLDSAVFQLTPTRTRCELVIIANGKPEKLASGLLNPFLAHLKTAQQQIAKGGYSITLQPDAAIDAFWFTKGTVERFVRFVSTPEILERVTTIESEIVQIEEAITIQGNENLGLTALEEHQMKSTESIEGSRPVFDTDAERAIVLYKPGSQSSLPHSNGSASQEENSKVQLLRVLETRKIVLQKEQGMAFARATAAGFDMDHMTHLIMFADCFGASRLKEACSRFMDLWKVKHETGQWFEVEAADAMSTRSGFPPFNASGIVLTADTMKHKEFGEWPVSRVELGTGSNGIDAITDHISDKSPSDPQAPPGPHEYFQGQYQQPTFPPWAMHPPTGPSVFQPYPMQGIPYYQNYPGSGPFYPPPYPSADDPRFNAHKRVGRRHSMNSKDNDIDSETSEETSEDDVSQILSDTDKVASHIRKSHKKAGRSGKKKPGVVVIKNINYVTSKKHEKSTGESQSASDTETESETEESNSDAVERKHKKSSRSSTKNEGRKKSPESGNAYDRDEMAYGNEADSGNWQAFQSFLLRSEEKVSVDGDMLAGEKEPSVKRKQKINEAEPILTPERDSGNIHEVRIMEFDSGNGNGGRTRQVAANDDLLASGDGRSGLRESHLDAQFLETESGGRGYRTVTSDDFMIYAHSNQISSTGSVDPLAEQGYKHPANTGKSSYIATDESFIVPFRSASQGQLETDNRTTIDIDLEFPSSVQRKEDSFNYGNNHLSYEPDDLTMIPERPIESEYNGYDPAIDCDMHIPLEVAVKQETEVQDLSETPEEELKKSAKGNKQKVPPNGVEKRKKDALMRRGAPSKSNPLTEAQKRAEKLRAYKVDLQKAKKANEEEERKRLEALKLERQKRIAARSSSNSIQSPSATKQTRSGVPTKVSPSSFKGLKLSDSEPGSSSPLQKLPIRSSSIGSNDSQKTAKMNRSNGSANGLTKSVSLLPEVKKEANGLMPEVKAAAACSKRLSNSNVKNIRHASQKSEDVVVNGPQMKISAIVQLDKTKSATLPELKIQTPRSPSDTVKNKSVANKTLPQNSGANATQASGSIQEIKDDYNPPRVNDDILVIEKTVVMLEDEMITGPALQVSECMPGINDNAKERVGSDSEYAAIRAPPSPIIVEEVEDPSQCKPDDQLDCYKAVNDSPKDDSQNVAKSVTEDYYQAPYARATSLEDSGASKLENTGTPNMQSEFSSVPTKSITAHASSLSGSNLIDQTNDFVDEKPRNKESKGFRKLWKFGRKNHDSASVEGSMDSDDFDDQAEPSSSNEAHILKNLISQDDHHAGSTPPRVHRPFSILAPFRSSKSNVYLA